MDNFSSTSKVEQEFINQCKKINPNIDPYIFLKKYHTFSHDYASFYEYDLLNLGNLLDSVFPNIDWSLSGRIKSKYSFCNKTLKKLYKNFNYDKQDPKEAKKIENHLAHILSFFNNTDFLLTILKERSINSQTKINMILSNLSPDDKKRFLLHLGMSDDIFAHRLIIRAVGTSISSTSYKDNKFFIKGPDGNEVRIEPSIKITNPEIIEQIQSTFNKNTNDYYRIFMKINGRKEQINLDNIEKNEDNTLKYNDDGSLTLQRDAIELPDKSIINITPSNLIKVDDDIYIKNPNGGLLNIKGLVLKKYDEPSISQGITQIMSYINNTYIPSKKDISDEYFEIPKERYKDYIKNPKSTGYKSIHATFLKKWLNTKKNKYVTKYSQEIQAESLLMDIDKEHPNSPISHNRYKSSADILSKLMTDPSYELSDLFPTLILVTKFPTSNGKTVVSYKADLETSIRHIIPNVNYKQLINERTFNDTEIDDSDLIIDDIDTDDYIEI